MRIIIKRIETPSDDINLLNEPFKLYGRMLPVYNGEWSYTVKYYEEKDVCEMTFPDEHYVFSKLQANSFFVGAYDEQNTCVGLAIYQQSWNKYLYLYDLKVKSLYRRSSIGRMLVEEGKKLALENGYNGVYTQGQDNNLSACLFYINSGFRIGGLDTMVYKGTMQEGKSDIIFYLDCYFNGKS